MLQDTVRYPQRWIILFSSIVLKKLILKHWKSTYPPMLLHWKKEMCYYLNMEKTIAIENNKLTQFEIIWGEIIQALGI